MGYRFHSRQKTYSIGPYGNGKDGTFSLADARRERDKAILCSSTPLGRNPNRAADHRKSWNIALPRRILAREESEERLGEDFRHLIGKRHHAASNLDHGRAGDSAGHLARDRKGMRIGGGRQYLDGTLHKRQTCFHSISIDDAVALSSQWTGLQSVDHEAVKQIMVACGIIRPTHLPERKQMAPLRASRRFIDDQLAGMTRATFGIDIGRRGKRYRRNPSGLSRRHLDRDRRSGVMANDCHLRQLEGVKQVEGTGGPGFDRIFDEREPSRVPKANDVHRNGSIMLADQREHVALFVPRARRLMQEQDRPALAGGGDVDSRSRRSDETAFNDGIAIGHQRSPAIRNRDRNGPR
jgi:hypothetical protein